MKTRAFRVKDLMINVLPARGRGGASAGLIGPDQDITDFTPITPIVIVVSKLYNLRAIEKLGLSRLTVDGFDAAALNLGRAALSGMFLCTENMPTCGANEAISPVATPLERLRLEDLVVAKEVLTEVIQSIDKVEVQRMRQVRSEVKEVAPLLEEALAELHREDK